MARNVLLLGRTGVVVDDVKDQLDMADVELFGGTGIEDVRSAFSQAEIDHVILGAGIDLEDRLRIVQEVFQLSDKTTVHMKDSISGPQGFLPFVRSVLLGVKDYEF